MRENTPSWLPILKSAIHQMQTLDIPWYYSGEIDHYIDIELDETGLHRLIESGNPVGRVAGVTFSCLDAALADIAKVLSLVAQELRELHFEFTGCLEPISEVRFPALVHLKTLIIFKSPSIMASTTLFAQFRSIENAYLRESGVSHVNKLLRFTPSLSTLVVEDYGELDNAESLDFSGCPDLNSISVVAHGGLLTNGTFASLEPLEQLEFFEYSNTVACQESILELQRRARPGFEMYKIDPDV